ncbi:MAG: hypothetical protein ACOZBH_02955 [Patescibacteria group bacterium]
MGEILTLTKRRLSSSNNHRLDGAKALMLSWGDAVIDELPRDNKYIYLVLQTADRLREQDFAGLITVQLVGVLWLGITLKFFGCTSDNKYVLIFKPQIYPSRLNNEEFRIDIPRVKLHFLDPITKEKRIIHLNA